MKTIIKYLCLVLFLTNAHVLFAQSISGKTNVCPNITERYTFSPSTCSMTWGVIQGPGNPRIVRQTSTFIDVEFPEVTSANTTFHLNANYSCGGSNIGNATLDVTVQPTNPPTSTTKNVECGYTGTVIFQRGLEGPNQNVTWTTNTGWPIASGPKVYHDKFNVYFYEIEYQVTNFNGGFVKLSAASSCSTVPAEEHTYNITRSPVNNLPAPVYTQRPSSGCTLTSNVFSVQPYEGAISYTWTADRITTKINGQTSPVTISAADNGHTVTFEDSNSDYVANISVSAQTSCGQTLAAATKLNIGHPIGSVTIFGPDKVTAGSIFVDYFLRASNVSMPTGSQVEWLSIPPDWTTLNYLANNTGIELGVGNQPGYIQAAVTVCGVRRGISKYVAIGTGGPIPPVPPLAVAKAGTKLNFSVYPNPATNNLSIVIPEQMQTISKGKIEVTVFDNNGVVQYREFIAAAKNTHSIDVSRLIPGTYTVKILSGTKQATAKFIRQ